MTTLPNGNQINILSLPYFIAAKLQAFQDRGRRGDIRYSQDIEDLAQVLDGCTTFDVQIMRAPPDVQQYIKDNFSLWLKDEMFFREAISGALAYSNTKVRENRIFQILKTICSVQ